MAVLKRSRLNQKDIDRIREGRAKDAEAEQGIPRPVGSGINNKLTVEDMCGTLEITDERWLEMKVRSQMSPFL